MTWPFVIFKRTEFQDMIGETVDEDEELMTGKKSYFGRQRIFSAYDTKYLRGDMKKSQNVFVSGYEYTYTEKIRLFLALFFPKLIHRFSTKSPSKK